MNNQADSLGSLSQQKLLAYFTAMSKTTITGFESIDIHHKDTGIGENNQKIPNETARMYIWNKAQYTISVG